MKPSGKPRPFTPSSLVGMSMGARKRAAWYEALRTSYDGDGGPISNRKLRLCLSVLTAKVLSVTVPFEWRLEVRAKYRIGERVRPCPGCPKCTDNPLRIVRALSRRMQLRFEIRRCNSSINPGKFDYLAMLHRSGPTWNPVCGFGPTQNDAVRALCDVILREGAEEFVIASCDGSGVLPARRP